MKRLILVIAFLFAVCSAAWAAPVLLDDFNRTAADPLDGSWTDPGFTNEGPLALRSNHAEISSIGTYNVAAARWTGGTYSGDQTVTAIVTFTNSSAFNRAGLAVKMTNNTTRTFYLCAVSVAADSWTVAIFNRTDGANTLMAQTSTAAWNNGDELKCTVTGTTTLTITAYVNGSSVVTADDDGSGTCTGCGAGGVHTGTSIGLEFYSDGDVSYAQIDDFSTDVPEVGSGARKRVVTID
jgi:hypothetical protein